MRDIIIGSRGSELALKQSEIVKEEILKVLPSVDIHIKVITTEGDRNMKAIPLDTIGKGWFTKEIEHALLDNEIDIAVHSLKDLPEILPDGLGIAAITKREDVRDVLISNNGKRISELEDGFIVGTDSIRRKIQILGINPNLIVKSVRGNVNTRLEKLKNGNFDALVLAAAGLIRLGKDNLITQYFDIKEVLPSPGQGALACETRIQDDEINQILHSINDENTFIEVEAERAFARYIGGGCKYPIGAYAKCKNNKLTLIGMLASLDGTEIVKDEIEGDCEDASRLGETLASSILDRMAIE